MAKKKKKIPKTHRFKIDDVVIFTFAGSKRIGTVIELTREDNRHATYTVRTTGARDRIYPCLGYINSKEVGNVLKRNDD